MFPHRNIHKYIWTSLDGKTHNQIDHILVDRRTHSNVLDVQSFREADCDSDHYLVVAKVRERLAGNKQRPHRFHMHKFNLNQLNEVDDKEQFCVQVSNGFAALEDLDSDVEINLKSHQLLAYADDVALLGGKTEILLDAIKEVGLEINVEKTKYMLLSRHQNVAQIRDIKIANRSFENVSQFKYLGSTVTNQNLIQEEIKRRLNSGNVPIVLDVCC
jgi:hypothetical protein